MRDEGLMVGAELAPAEEAVNYMLRRLRLDADLRWHMLGTEAFATLCRAEASRVGRTEEEIRAIYSEPAPHCANINARLPECRELLDQIAMQTYGDDRGSETLTKIRRLAESRP